MKSNENKESFSVRASKQKRTNLRALYGMWKNKKPDPINELEKMRKEWE